MTETQNGSPKQRYLLDRRVDDIAAKVAAGDDDDLISTINLAKMAGTTTQFWEELRHKGTGPRFVKLSNRRVRYRKCEVLAWLEARSHLRINEYTPSPKP